MLEKSAESFFYKKNRADPSRSNIYFLLNEMKVDYFYINCTNRMTLSTQMHVRIKANLTLKHERKHETLTLSPYRSRQYYESKVVHSTKSGITLLHGLES